jgi:hypothetical protein
MYRKISSIISVIFLFTCPVYPKDNHAEPSLQITPPDKITEGMAAGFKIALKKPDKLLIIPAKGYSKYGNVYKKNSEYFYNTLTQQETSPVFYNVQGNFSADVQKVFTKEGPDTFIFELEIFDPAFLKPEHLYIVKKTQGALISYRKLKNFSALKKQIFSQSGISESLTEVLIPDADKIPKKTLKAQIEVRILGCSEIQPFKKKYNPETYRFFPEINLWALFLKEKTVLLKNEKDIFKEIPAGRTDEAAISIIAGSKEHVQIWIVPENGCISDFVKNHGKSNKGPDGDQMYHRDANSVLTLPLDKFFDFAACIEKDGYLFTARSWSGFSSPELWIFPAPAESKNKNQK